jgi:hypothetical protein
LLWARLPSPSVWWLEHSYLGRAAGAVIPRLPFTWSIVTGVLGAVLGTYTVLGAVLGTYTWQLVGLDAPVAVGQLTGAVVALDIYIAVAKAIRRS